MDEGLNPVAIMTDAIGELSATVAAIAPAALAVAIAVFGLYFGWNIVRRFVN